MLMDQLHSPLGGVVAIVCSGLYVWFGHSLRLLCHTSRHAVSLSWWYANAVELSKQELSMSEWMCAE